MALKLLGVDGNLRLVWDQDRRFPGLLVQGDTLSILLTDLEEELPEGCATQTVREWVAAYEELMAAAGIGLPYMK